jgi:1-acyl-sn-glycerol-3-phosphate acyltransferase
VDRLAAWWTAGRVFTHLLGGVTQGKLLLPRLSKQTRDRRIQTWARGMLERLGVELQIVGAPAKAGPMLLVSNHMSWVDILALHAACPCRLVSKADVAHWPLLGALARGAGALFVRRESRRDAMRVVHGMAQALRDGDIVAVFPEGTTTDGGSVLPFHSSLIQAAIAADVPVQAVALDIVDASSGRRSGAASYMGDESLVDSIWRTLCAKELCVALTFGAPQLAAGRDRRAWARDLRSEIVAMRQPSSRP